ncbi:MAG: DUF2254 domain-containing protein [Chitinivibrionales bacterium]|nr:DUF2254 domain-containing protein [Chitinivibrionales bacterium]
MRFLRRRRARNPRFGADTWVYIAVALAMGFVLPRINELYFPAFVSPIDKPSITAILSAIASGMMTLTGIVFSLVFVILQFGSSAYSPRLIRLFARTHVLNHALGIFTGTFFYSLMALREVGIRGRANVSAVTVWVAMVWLLASVAALALLLRVFTALTITNVLTALGRAGRTSIARIYSPLSSEEDAGRRARPPHQPRQGAERASRAVVYHGEPGYVVRYDTAALLALARKNDSVIRLPYAVGDALKDGEPVALIEGPDSAITDEQLYEPIVLGRERRFQHDPKYALRLLVDTAIRALSPAVNDPTTAVQSLDHIESLLRRLGNVDLDIGEIRDSDGALRVIFKTPRWEDYLLLGLSEVMYYGETSLQVERRLEALLLFLRRSVPQSRAEIVDRFYEQRRAMSSAAFTDATLRDVANVPDREGIGSGDGIVTGHVRAP